MPIAGWSVGRFAAELIHTYDHWVAFTLLLLIGGKMIYEAIWGERMEEEESGDPQNVYILLTLSFATSIDAAVVGVSLSFLGVAIIQPLLIISIITFFISLLGIAIGCKAGSIFGKKIEILGGLVLIGIGAKILVQPLFQ